jgi:bifunctional UDP-N-acetylglucosamine pyrophosphorylase/glucosamine-1-phosphate N-acetyltransferase
MPVDIVILAAGQGTRMNSSLPKVLHRIAGKSLLQHVVDAASAFGDVEIHIVIGHGAALVRESIQGAHLHWVMQEQQLGTGHALLQALPNLREDAVVLVLYGDVPLVNASTLKQLVIQVDESNMALLTVELDNPSGYGRVLRDADNSVHAIVEHKDASEEQRRVHEVNTGIMAVHQRRLAGWLKELTNHNAQKEYYLTDIIGFASRDGVTVNAIVSESTAEVLGVNDRYQQAQLERLYQQRTARQLMAQGVTLMDPARFDCRGHLTAGRDVYIDVNVVFEGQVTLGHHVHIEPNCIIRNARIGNHVVIKANSVLEEAVIADNCDIGPFARLRPGTQLKSGVRIGNFVETKKAVIGRDSKINHLSYIGDAEIGEDSNIGAGTITCNYDGVNKYKTRLGDNVFIGSNTALVAPVTVGNGATVGAGSVVTSDVKENQLAVARGKQRNIDGWKRPTKNHETR